MKNDGSLHQTGPSEPEVYSFNSLDNFNTAAIEPWEADYNDEALTFDYKSTSDEMLIRRYLHNEDEEAFNEIVDRYGWKIHRLAFGITHDMHNADDVLQDVFVIVIEKSHTFREDSKFSTWLYRVAANTSFLYLRKKRKQDQDLSLESEVTYDQNGYLKGADLQDWGCIPEDVAIRREEMDKIEMAINEMPETSRTVFHLSAMDGLQNSEIGEILGLTLPAVKSRLRRAKLFLRARLEAEFLQHMNQALATMK